MTKIGKKHMKLHLEDPQHEYMEFDSVEEVKEFIRYVEKSLSNISREHKNE